mmetsp:Transcript_24797/g.86338  ORF Transcript_24797/g.86338 Transcript_24797/m.86338 type:complete len:395 (+) Transcript_24797:1295-2479(+)
MPSHERRAPRPVRSPADGGAQDVRAGDVRAGAAHGGERQREARAAVQRAAVVDAGAVERREVRGVDRRQAGLVAHVPAPVRQRHSVGVRVLIGREGRRQRRQLAREARVVHDAAVVVLGERVVAERIRVAAGAAAARGDDDALRADAVVHLDVVVAVRALVLVVEPEDVADLVHPRRAEAVALRHDHEMLARRLAGCRRAGDAERVVEVDLGAQVRRVVRRARAEAHRRVQLDVVHRVRERRRHDRPLVVREVAANLDRDLRIRPQQRQHHAVSGARVRQPAVVRAPFRRQEPCGPPRIHLQLYRTGVVVGTVVGADWGRSDVGDSAHHHIIHEQATPRRDDHGGEAVRVGCSAYRHGGCALHGAARRHCRRRAVSVLHHEAATHVDQPAAAAH